MLCLFEWVIYQLARSCHQRMTGWWGVRLHITVTHILASIATGANLSPPDRSLCPPGGPRHKAWRQWSCPRCTLRSSHTRCCSAHSRSQPRNWTMKRSKQESREEGFIVYLPGGHLRWVHWSKLCPSQWQWPGPLHRRRGTQTETPGADRLAAHGAGRWS